jgi:hypothetical protein
MPFRNASVLPALLTFGCALLIFVGARLHPRREESEFKGFNPEVAFEFRKMNTLGVLAPEE